MAKFTIVVGLSCLDMSNEYAKINLSMTDEPTTIYLKREVDDEKLPLEDDYIMLDEKLSIVGKVEFPFVKEEVDELKNERSEFNVCLAKCIDGPLLEDDAYVNAFRNLLESKKWKIFNNADEEVGPDWNFDSELEKMKKHIEKIKSLTANLVSKFNSNIE